MRTPRVEKEEISSEIQHFFSYPSLLLPLFVFRYSLFRPSLFSSLLSSFHSSPSSFLFFSFPGTTENKPAYGHCRNEAELWLPLLEKAYAKLHSCYEALEGGSEVNGRQMVIFIFFVSLSPLPSLSDSSLFVSILFVLPLPPPSLFASWLGFYDLLLQPVDSVSLFLFYVML